MLEYPCSRQGCLTLSAERSKAVACICRVFAMVGRIAALAMNVRGLCLLASPITRLTERCNLLLHRSTNFACEQSAGFIMTQEHDFLLPTEDPSTIDLLPVSCGSYPRLYQDFRGKHSSHQPHGLLYTWHVSVVSLCWSYA